MLLAASGTDTLHFHFVIVGYFVEVGFVTVVHFGIPLFVNLSRSS